MTATQKIEDLIAMVRSVTNRVNLTSQEEELLTHIATYLPSTTTTSVETIPASSGIEYQLTAIGGKDETTGRELSTATWQFKGSRLSLHQFLPADEYFRSLTNDVSARTDKMREAMADPTQGTIYRPTPLDAQGLFR